MPIGAADVVDGWPASGGWLACQGENDGPVGLGSRVGL